MSLAEALRQVVLNGSDARMDRRVAKRRTDHKRVKACKQRRDFWGIKEQQPASTDDKAVHRYIGRALQEPFSLSAFVQIDDGDLAEYLFKSYKVSKIM